MTEQEARHLAAQIDSEPGWNAEPQHNTWTGEWRVEAWQGDRDADQDNSYVLNFRNDWYRLRAGLAEEAAGVEYRQEYEQEEAEPAGVVDDLPF